MMSTVIRTAVLTGMCLPGPRKSASAHSRPSMASVVMPWVLPPSRGEWTAHRSLGRADHVTAATTPAEPQASDQTAARPSKHQANSALQACGFVRPAVLSQGLLNFSSSETPAVLTRPLFTRPGPLTSP